MSVTNVLRQVWSNPLNARSGRAAAFGRLVRWQLASRLMPAGAALPFVNGSVLYAERGAAGATGNWYGGLHEVEEMGFVLHALRPGELMVDIGANIGSYTILAAAGVGAEVICAEPLPATFARLRRNIAVNGVGDRVAAHQLGLSDKAGALRFTAALDTMNRVMRDDEAGDAVEVPIVPLDALLAGRAPRLMKIDVEGHEHAVLAGGTRTLAHPELQAVLMETNGFGHRFGVENEALFAIMRGNGFVPCRYDPFARRLHPAGDAAANTIFARDPAALDAICAAAPRYDTASGSI